MTFEDVLYDARDGIAWITINRPDVRNAFRSQTVDELIRAFRAAWADRAVGVAVLTGAGDKAFSAGGDQRERGTSGYGGASGLGMDVHGLHGVIRAIPKPVIAMVNGFAIGGGHVLHVLCDLSIAADTAIFGQVGPRVGSVDPGFGTAYLARIVGEKKAREIWYLCRQYTAQEALAAAESELEAAREELGSAEDEMHQARAALADAEQRAKDARRAVTSAEKAHARATKDAERALARLRELDG